MNAKALTQAEALQVVKELSEHQTMVSAELAARAIGTTGQTIREAARQNYPIGVKTVVLGKHRVNVTCKSILALME